MTNQSEVGYFVITLGDTVYIHPFDDLAEAERTAEIMARKAYPTRMLDQIPLDVARLIPETI